MFRRDFLRYFIHIPEFFTNRIGLVTGPAIQNADSLSFFDFVADFGQTAVTNRVIDFILGLYTSAADLANGIAK